MKFSRLMLGTVQFGLRYGINNRLGQPSPDDVAAILRAAADGGIDVLDTARNYGDSEAVLGLALEKTGLASHFRIISKIKRFPAGLAAADAPGWVENSITTSLKLLKRKSLDGLLLHHEDDLPFFALLETCRAKGYAEAIGVSLDSRQSLAAVAQVELMMAQLPGNIVDRRFFPLAEKLRRQGGAVFMRSVYLQGMLFKPEAEVHPALGPLLTVRKALEKLARDAGIAPGELYFRYMLGLTAADSILTGVDSVSQLRENLTLAARGVLPADLIRAVDRVVPELPENQVRPGNWPK